MRETIRRNLIKYAIQRYLFCKDCGTVLDVDSTTLVTIQLGKSGGARPFCSKCIPCTMTKAAELAERARQTLTFPADFRVELETTNQHLELELRLDPAGSKATEAPWEQTTLDLGGEDVA